ncbi:uncharacterized protein LOC144095402 [Amblyomma americanum]
MTLIDLQPNHREHRASIARAPALSTRSSLPALCYRPALFFRGGDSTQEVVKSQRTPASTKLVPSRFTIAAEDHSQVLEHPPCSHRAMSRTPKAAAGPNQLREELRQQLLTTFAANKREPAMGEGTQGVEDSSPAAS